MRISDWSSDVCSSDLPCRNGGGGSFGKTLVAECPDGLRAHNGADRVAEPRRRERVAEAFIADDVEKGFELLVQRDCACGVSKHILDRVGAIDRERVVVGPGGVGLEDLVWSRFS